MRTDTMIPKTVRKLLAPLAIILSAFSLAACGGGGGGGGAGVGFSQTTYTVAAGASIPLAVTASGTNDLTMTFSASGGTVSSVGVYTAPATPGTYTVTATNNATKASATATITVTSFGGYSGAFANISTVNGLRTARSNHTATLLTTGWALISGGLDGSATAVNKAESFNPKAGAFGHFSSLHNMTTPRAYHTATILMNGKVLITGGINNSNTPLNSVEIYDPFSNTFTATGSMTTARWMHSATLLPNGKVLVAGGTSVTPAASSGIEGNPPLDSAELYDPVTGTFTALTVNMLQPRYYHTATLLPNGKVLLAGGQGRLGQKLADAELFDPVAMSFAATGNNMVVDPTIDTGRWIFTATLLRDDTLFVVGGDGGTIAGAPNFLASGQIYDPVLNNFIDFANQMTDARAFHAVAMRVDGTVLIVGGIGGNAMNPPLVGDVLASAEIYDPAAKSFASTGSLNNARANHTATALASGKILIAGGNQGGLFLKSAEIYQ
jgi:Kelch motif/Galactose oxidase, central domain